MKRIAIVGSGTMGNGIAHVFGLHGFEIARVDVSMDVLYKVMDTISKNMDRQISKGSIK